MSARTKPIIGILFAGEMGATLGKFLCAQGYRVVTTLEERSQRTCQLARDAGLELLPALADLAGIANVVLSLVPPGAAQAVAERYCANAALQPGSLFVDLNSISPEAALAVAGVCGQRRVRFVDGAIHGMATRLPGAGTLYLSGAFAQEVAELFAPVLRVKVLGEAVGQASAFKMLISGFAKGVVAVFLEMALTAREADLLDELTTCYRDAYPGIMELVDRLVPTYPLHAARRGVELEEVGRMMRGMGLQPCLVSAARQLTAAIGGLDLACQKSVDGVKWSVPDVIEAIFAGNPLRDRAEKIDSEARKAVSSL